MTRRNRPFFRGELKTLLLIYNDEKGIRQRVICALKGQAAILSRGRRFTGLKKHFLRSLFLFFLFSFFLPEELISSNDFNVSIVRLSSGIRLFTFSHRRR